eukprot:1185378-Prorocentrum_minimum.AAC.6
MNQKSNLLTTTSHGNGVQEYRILHFIPLIRKSRRGYYNSRCNVKHVGTAYRSTAFYILFP